MCKRQIVSAQRLTQTSWDTLAVSGRGFNKWFPYVEDGFGDDVQAAA